ncbi:glycosyltransferase [Nocardioides sp. W7]|uniref:glycosyltransferase n=1 Tax=Nocardioides sp. W7 TaxID=2931390 RepID=UPI001FD37776|nr:glycosyltransferase [Nocardioides sp. W7]
MTPPLAALRLLVVTPSGVLGGSERWLLDLLDAAGHRLRPEVWLLEDGPLRAELEARGTPVTVLPTGRRAASLAARGLDLRRRLRASDAEVVLANGVKAAAAVVPAARVVGVPVCWAKHDFSWDRELARPLGRLADEVLAMSASVAEPTGRTDAVVVPPPRSGDAPADRGVAESFWTGHGLPPATGPTVAMIGRLVGYKGVDTAVRALAEPAAGEWRLVVVGAEDPTEPDEARRLSALAEELGVADRVHLLKSVEGAGHYLAAFDAVAVLTRRAGRRFGREGYSLVALEALAAGVPLVGAAGNPEVERMARTAGRVVPPEDPGAVAAALGELRGPEVAGRCGTAGRAVVATHPDRRSWAERVVAVLARAARRPGAGLAGPPMTVLTCFKDEQGNVDDVASRVLAQLGPDDEYLAIDDGSTDGTGAELARWSARDSRIRVLAGPAVNLSSARNAGFAVARHDHVACTDAGCVPGEDWLAGLRAPFAEPDPVDLVVGVYDVDGGDPVRDAARVALFPSLREARRPSAASQVLGRVTGRRFSARRLDGRSMACTVDAWRRAGGFDPALDSSEDAVFGEAVLATGGRSALALDARVTWAQAGRLRDMARMYARYGEWGGRSGSWPLVSRDLVRGAAYLVGPVGYAVGGPRTRALVATAATGYLAATVARAQDEPVAPGTWPLVPVLVALKDVAKAAGCLRGLLGRRTPERANPAASGD